MTYVKYMMYMMYHVYMYGIRLCHIVKLKYVFAQWYGRYRWLACFKLQKDVNRRRIGQVQLDFWAAPPTVSPYSC